MLLNEAKEVKPKTPIKNFVGILGTNSCTSILHLFVSVFVVAQVFLITNYDIMAVALFLLVEVLAIFAFYFISSWVCKKVRAIWLIRLAALFACAFLIMTIVWYRGLETHYMLFGALWGAVQGLHWGAMNFLITRIIDKNRSMKYFVFAFAISAIIGILFPFTFGFAIDHGSWIITSSVVLAVIVVQLVFTFIVKTTMQDDRKLRIGEYFRALKTANHLKPAITLWFAIAIAGFQWPMTAVMSILIIMVYGTSMSIGILGSVFALVGIIALIIYKHSGRRVKTPLFWFSSFILLVVSIALFFYVGPWSVILFNACLVLPRKIVNLEEQGVRINAVRFWGGEEYIIESHLFYEFALMTGRILSCVILIIVGLVGVTQILLAAVISFVALCWGLHAVMLFFWRRKYVDKK